MKKHILSILTAGCLWGFMGLFTRNMSTLGFSLPGTLIIRCGIACIFFGLMLLMCNPKLFLIKLKDVWCFLGVGLCSLLFFTYCYFQAISLMSLSSAAILLYTAPAIVMIMSLFIFKEKLTSVKILALLMAFAGCCLVSGLGSRGMTASTLGVIYGLCSGFGYALYSIFARLALNRGYDSRTINFYACLLAVMGAIVIWGGSETTLIFQSTSSVLWSLGTGIISCFLPYLFYTYGLSGVEAGKAAVMASVEPVVATIVGIIVFREKFSSQNAFGVLLVLGAIVLLNIRRRKSS